MKFQPARPEVGYLKVGMYGSPGSGKTFTSLLCATRLGKTLMVDTEQGSTLYAPHPEYPREKDFPSFDILHTRDIHQVTEAISEACKQGYDAVIIDQATHLWEFCQDDFLERERKQASKLYYDFERTGNFPFMAWKKIKKPWKKFVRVLLDTPIHIFITGRLVAEYEVGGGDGRASITKSGDRMGGEKDLEYEVHITLKLERLSSKVKAYVKKDRSGTLSGIIINPKGDIFDEVLKRLGKEHKEIPQDVEFQESGKKLIHPEALLFAKLAMKGGATQDEVDEVLSTSSLIEIKNLNRELLVGKCVKFKKIKEEKKHGKN